MVSFFLDGQTVCAGYAKTYQYLMEKAGIPDDIHQRRAEF